MLVHGKIPKNTECPYTKVCKYKELNLCKHTGVKHTVEFSCGCARLFKIMLKECK